MKLCHSLLADGAPGRRGFRAPEADGSKTTSAGALTGVGFGLPFTILWSSSLLPLVNPPTNLFFEKKKSSNQFQVTGYLSLCNGETPRRRSGEEELDGGAPRGVTSWADGLLLGC
jgi:hypothetical protein